MRFRTKTILGVALIEIALLAVLVGSALQALRDSNELELTQRVQLGGKLIAVAAKDAVISQDLATLDSLVIEAMASEQIAYVRILDAAGVVLAQRGDAGVLARPFHVETAIDQVEDGIFDWSGPVLSGGIRHGEVQLGVSIAPLKVLLDSARRWAAGIAGLEILLVAVFSWLLGSYLVRQLTELRTASQRFATGDFEQRVPVRGDDELAETALAFNSMAQQLGDGRDQLRAENLARLEAQQRAEDRTEQLNAIFELSPDGFVSFDETLRVKYASPAFTRMTGIGLAQLSGVNEQEFTELLALRCAPESCFSGFDGLRKRAASRQPGAQELIELTVAGKRILDVGLRKSDASTVSQILYFRDVTHETEVDQMKSEFLTTAAHELRTPMASIYGFAEVLMTQELDDASRQEFLAIIWKQSEWMASILNELLDLARIEARQGKDFVFEAISAQALMDEVVRGFKLPQGRLAPTLSVPESTVTILVDHKKARQAVLNVLSNAYKYSPNGASVSMALESVVAEAGAPEMIAIRITDQGIGMTPEQISHVCERFYRADASGAVLGTGLGMSIVKEIVDLHHGRLVIESQIGQGTAVTLLWPVDRFF